MNISNVMLYCRFCQTETLQHVVTLYYQAQHTCTGCWETGIKPLAPLDGDGQ